MNILYLGISGVLHPSFSFYRYVHGREASEDGHRKYQSVDALDEALIGWPSARIVLTSTQPWAKGLAEVLVELGPLASRVDGFSFEDLTTKAPSRTRRGRPMYDVDYWRLSKGEIVHAHVDWLRPQAWIALDDEDLGWDDEDREERLVLTSGTNGLKDRKAMDRLMTVLEGNFGRPGSPAARKEQG